MDFLDSIRTLHELKKIQLQQENINNAESFIASLELPDVLVAVTNDPKLNFQLVKHAKAAGCMVYAVDNPEISDFMLPALAKIDDVRIAVSTSGKSPYMGARFKAKNRKNDN